MLPHSSLLFHTAHASCYGYRKPIPIQGTNIKLDTPEALEQWIAERKKRFPTAERVAEKEQKLSEAIERGQLPVDDPRQPRQKRRRIEESSNVSARGRGRGRGRGADRGWRGRGGGVAGHTTSDKLDLSLPPKPVTTETPSQSVAVKEDLDSDSSSDSDSDGAPEVISSKLAPEQSAPQEDAQMGEPETPKPTDVKPQAHRKVPARQPRRPPHNPFASRPSLLRNVSTNFHTYNHNLRISYHTFPPASPSRDSYDCLQPVPSYTLPRGERLLRQRRAQTRAG